MPARSRQIQIVLDEIDLQVAHTRDRIGLGLVDQLVQAPPVGTPILTGWASAGWMPSLGKRADAGLEPTAEPSELQVRSAQAAQQMQIAKVVTEGPSKPDLSLYVTNNRPYINRLNKGHSQQNRRFVEKAIEVVVGIEMAELKAQRKIVGDHAKPVGLDLL